MSVPPTPPPVPPAGTAPMPAGSGPSAGPALSYGWAKFQQHAGVFVGIILVAFVAQVLLSIIGQVSGSIALSLILSIVGFIVSLVAQFGMYNAALMVTRGETPSFANAFQNDRWGPWVGFSIVYGICVALGLILCGIGIVLTAGLFGLAPFFFIDGRKGIGEAISASFNATKSDSSLLVAVILCAIVGFLGFIACGVGALITLPLANIAVASLYRGVTGSLVAA